MASMNILGVVRFVRIVPNAENPQLATLVMVTEKLDRFAVPISREALRGLWAHLTQFLYPRAANQLTSRTETVVHGAGNLAEDVTYAATAYPDSANPSRIVVGGFTRVMYWAMTLERHTCEDLWANLEDWLKQV